MKSINKNTEERGAALTHAHLLNRCAGHLDGERSTGKQRLRGRQHSATYPNGLQLVLEKMMLDSVIGLLEVHKAGIRGALGDASCVNKMAQGKEVMDRRLPGPETCLGWAAQLMFPTPSHQPSVEYDVMTSG